MTTYSAETRAAIESRIDKRGPDECWPWTGAVARSGLPLFHSPHWEGNGSQSARKAVHRLFCGPVPAGAVVRTACENRKCVNPAHLILSGGRQAGDLVPAPKLLGECSSELALRQLDSITSEHEPEVVAAIRDAEVRLQSLNAILVLCRSRPAPAPTAQTPSPSKPASTKVPLKKPAAKQPAPKVPQAQPERGPTEMARRLMFMLRDREERRRCDLARALNANEATVRAVVEGAQRWLEGDAHGVRITDAGVAWCLQQEAERA